MKIMSVLSKRIGCVLIDLSGTLHIEDLPIPGAIESLQKLRDSQNLRLKFVTNTTKESKQTLLSRLTRIGFNIEEKEVFTSLTAARKLLENRNLRPFYMLSEDALNDFSGINSDEPNAVVVGLAPTEFHYENMTKAFRLLLDGSTLVAIHKARYYKRKDGLALGPGAFVTALEYSAGVKAEVVGKPEAAFFLSALSEVGETPEETVMIGDDAKDDVEGALKAGLSAILVKTGKYRPDDENTIEPKPTFVAENFSKAVEFILNHNSKFE
ncbi:cytochrome P450 2L1 [Armadillidium vulgare]|nr:cytochrome P450 2L1 [Armadillidium vulgare]